MPPDLRTQRGVLAVDDDPPVLAAIAREAPGSGTGLGLNISHNIVVRQHSGRIAVTSAPGRTRFRVELPIIRQTANEEASRPAN